HGRDRPAVARGARADRLGDRPRRAGEALRGRRPPGRVDRRDHGDRVVDAAPPGALQVPAEGPEGRPRPRRLRRDGDRPPPRARARGARARSPAGNVPAADEGRGRMPALLVLFGLAAPIVAFPLAWRAWTIRRPLLPRLGGPADPVPEPTVPEAPPPRPF